MLVYGYNVCMGTLPQQIHRAGHKNDHKHYHLGMHQEKVTSAYMKSNFADCSQPIMTIVMLVLSVSLNGQSLILYSLFYGRSHKSARLKKSQDKYIRSSVWFMMIYFTKYESCKTIPPERIPLW